MATITANVTAITKMVRGRMEAVPLNSIVSQPTLHSVRHLVEQLAKFANNFSTTKWGGKHGFLLLVLSKAKIRPADGNNNLECERLKKPDLINPQIEDSTQGRELLQFQMDQKVECQYYTFQEVFDSVAVKYIVADVDAQYVKYIKEEYMGLKTRQSRHWLPRSARGMLSPPSKICISKPTSLHHGETLHKHMPPPLRANWKCTKSSAKTMGLQSPTTTR